MSRTTPARARAFTLVEIMVVVLIVGILSLLALFVIGRIKAVAARSSIENNLRQLHHAKTFYFGDTGSIDPVSVKLLLDRGYIRTGLYERLTSAGTLEARLGWHYVNTAFLNDPVAAYRGVAFSPSLPGDDVVFYPGPPSDSAAYAASLGVVAPSAPGAPSISGVRLMPAITGATPLSANAQTATGVPRGVQLVGLYMAGSDQNELAGIDPSRLPRVDADYHPVANSGFQYFDGRGVFGQLMPSRADNLRPLAPHERNSWNGGVAVFSDGSVARLEKVCNGLASSGERDYAYFSRIEGVNANQGMAIVSGTAQPGQSVEVRDGGRLVGTVQADGQGQWTMPAPASLAADPSALSIVPVRR